MTTRKEYWWHGQHSFLSTSGHYSRGNMSSQSWSQSRLKVAILRSQSLFSALIWSPLNSARLSFSTEVTLASRILCGQLIYIWQWLLVHQFYCVHLNFPSKSISDIYIICTHFSSFKKMGWFVTVTKTGSRKWGKWVWLFGSHLGLPSGSPRFESDRRTEILRSLSFN